MERQAQRILVSTKLPDSYPVGAKKAYEAFQEFYGSADGRRIFVKKALEQGQGETVHDKIADVFKAGVTVDQTKKLDTRVQVRWPNGPQMTTLSQRGGIRIVKAP